ncbi:unnamed protein product [Cochlearia groenlandica]
MSSFLSSAYSESVTGVFWDLDDCPIPEKLTPASISANIKLALTNIGYKGSVSITAYSVDVSDKNTKQEFDYADIKLVNPKTSRDKVNTMFKEVCGWGVRHRFESTNLMMISKDISSDVDTVESLLLLNKKDNNILLAHPNNTSGVLLYTATSIWLWSSLSKGGKPIDNHQSAEGRSSRISSKSSTTMGCTVCRKRANNKERKRQAKRRESKKEKVQKTEKQRTTSDDQHED